jgi:hypothetical protein
VAALGLPPLAHEDDAARGVQAALAMRQALAELGLGCAIVVASGRAFCGEIGSRQRREYTMIGDVVNLAARLMQAAATADDRPPTTADTRSSVVGGRSSILCDEATAQAAQSRMAFEPLDPIAVKGKAEPIAIYRPLRTATIQSKNQNAKSQVALVGRAAEQAALAEQLQALLRAGQGGVALIESEAGMGKTRLIEATCDLAAELGIMVLLGAGDPMEQATPYFAWRDIFSQLLDLGALETPAAQRRRVLDLLANDPDLLPLAPLLGAVLPLDLPETPATAQLGARARAEATRDLLLRLLQRNPDARRGAAGRAPTLVVLEDAHWLDSASWALAQAAGQRVRGLLLMLGLRPLAGAANAHQQPEIGQLFAAARPTSATWDLAFWFLDWMVAVLSGR